MKVQKIEQSATINTLDSRGTMEGLPGTPIIELAGLKIAIPEKEGINTGIFECTMGTYRRIVQQAEIMHILEGKGTFTPDGESAIDFKAGDSLFFAENTQGLWDIETRMRKVYVIF
jgi:uncharacterized protein